MCSPEAHIRLIVLDERKQVSPLPKGEFGTFRDNIAHTAIAGLMVYPQFQVESGEYDARVERFISWRHLHYGIRIMAASRFWEIAKSDIIGNVANIALMDNVVARISDTTIRKDPLNPSGCLDGYCIAIQNSKTTQVRKREFSKEQSSSLSLYIYLSLAFLFTI